MYTYIPGSHPRARAAESYIMKRPVLRAASFANASVNPFAYDYSNLKFSCYQISKIALNTVLLVPFRILVITICTLLMWFSSLLILIGLKSASQISSGWRRGLIGFMVVCLRGLLFGLGFWWIKVKGKRAPREEAPIKMLLLHSSYIDMLVSGYVLGVIPFGVHREENKQVPFFGTMLKATHQIFVSRTDTDSRRTAVAQMIDRVKDNRLAPVVIVPEGLCTNQKALISFKQGAFIPGCPVQPIVYCYRNQMDTTTWTWTGLSGGLSAYLTLCQFANYLEVEFLPVYKPSEEERKDPTLYANNVRFLVAKALNLPTSDFSYDDIGLLTAAMTESDSVPIQAGMVEFVKLKDKLKMGLDEVKNLLGRFQASETVDGCVNVEEFAGYLNLPVSSELREVFNLYDKNGDGQIDFREYLISVALLFDRTNTEDILRLAFQVFGTDGGQFVTRHQMKKILCVAFDRIEDEHVDDVFRESDMDHQGAVSYDQFIQFCSKQPDYAVLLHHYRRKKHTHTATRLKHD